MPRYDALHEGDPLSPARRRPTSARVRQFVEASGMQGRQFIDAATAARMALAGPIVPGPMKFAYLQQYLVRWARPDGALRHLRVAYRQPDLQDAELTLGARITRKYEEDGERRLDIELFIEDARGERSLHGSATLAFP